MPRMSITQTKKGVYPDPSYEAHFANGRVVRMSFWTKEKKPWDIDRGRRLCARIAEREGTSVADGFIDQHMGGATRTRSQWRAAYEVRDFAGMAAARRKLSEVKTEEADALKAGQATRFRDPYFSGEQVTAARVKRITAKQARDALANLLDWLDGGHQDDTALVRARELVAA